MATYTVSADAIGTSLFTMTANTADVVTFTDDLTDVEVVSDGAAAVYYTIDGSTPSINGANCYYLPSGVASVDARKPRTDGGTVVKLISAGTPSVRVQRG